MNKSFPDRRTAVLSLAATEAAGVIVPSELKGQTVMARTEQNANVESIRGSRGASILGPRNIPLERENPDLLASPYTDAGIIPNLKFPFAATRNRLATGGWAREVTVLPVSPLRGRVAQSMDGP
jgi:hypothetical protein